MVPRFAKLVKANENNVLSPKTDREFFFLFQQALLMMLRDESLLTEKQLTQALALLREEYER